MNVLYSFFTFPLLFKAIEYLANLYAMHMSTNETVIQQKKDEKERKEIKPCIVLFKPVLPKSQRHHLHGKRSGKTKRNYR